MDREKERISAALERSLHFRMGTPATNIDAVAAACPKCGGEVICAYADMGLTDFYHTFAHVCLAPKGTCDFVEEDQRFESNMGGGSGMPGLTKCPFCAREVN